MNVGSRIQLNFEKRASIAFEFERRPYLTRKMQVTRRDADANLLSEFSQRCLLRSFVMPHPTGGQCVPVAIRVANDKDIRVVPHANEYAPPLRSKHEPADEQSPICHPQAGAPEFVRRGRPSGCVHHRWEIVITRLPSSC